MRFLLPITALILLSSCGTAVRMTEYDTIVSLTSSLLDADDARTTAIAFGDAAHDFEEGLYTIKYFSNRLGARRQTTQSLPSDIEVTHYTYIGSILPMNLGRYINVYNKTMLYLIKTRFGNNIATEIQTQLTISN